jgi:hypothetical protein
MADDLDFMSQLGAKRSEFAEPKSAYEKVLMQLARDVMTKLRNVTLQKAQNSGGLASSIAVTPKGALSISIDADFYFKFMDEGVNPVSGKLFPSPYSFKYPNVSKSHAAALQSWKGYDPQHAYASATVTKNRYGLKPRKILEEVINENTLKQMTDDLSTMLGIALEVTFVNSTK